MRIMFAITKGEVGGAQEHVKVLAEGLVRAGQEVAIVVSRPSYLAESVDSAIDVFDWPSIVRSIAPWSDWRARRELADATSKWQPDVLHLNSSKAGVVGTGLLRAPRGVTVFTCHHAPFGPGRQWSHRLVARPVEQILLPKMDGIISDGIRDIPMLRHIAPKVPIRLIPNAVPPVGSPASTGALRPVALWVARMARPKDPLLAVKAWERVVQVIPEARLIMCGTGPLESSLRRFITSSPARDAIEYLGFVDDLRAQRARASAFLLATRVEGGITMATLEAMTEGLVPVVSDAGDAPQLEIDGCGICVRVRGPEAMAEAMVGLFQNEHRFEVLRANALRYSRQTRTPQHLLHDTMDFYREVLASAGQSQH